MQINGATELYGIMGNPVRHSLSPAMHNAAFGALDLNKVYVPFAVEDVAAAMTGFRAMGVKGVSVTIPHKQAVIEHLDSIDPVAKKIGAVNTLVINHAKIHGLNTDWLGANRALAEQIEIKGSSVLLLGAGGSARAIGFGLLEAGAAVTIASRTPATGRALADSLGVNWLPIAKAPGHQADILINATSVGMTPKEEQSPIAATALADYKVVMDIVYAPLDTKLLQEAELAGCRTVNGLAMLLYQGVAQFETWTGRAAPVDLMQKSLLTSLGYTKE
ncbi:MAG: shikimate dehydrogenase [Desulfobulbaceae bacterium]|nr:shikimate dehydrogenase [Desulfobulbaceae bacterium]